MQVETGAGRFAGVADAAYDSAGADIVADGAGHGDVLFHVRPLAVPDVQRLAAGAITVGTVENSQRISGSDHELW